MTNGHRRLLAGFDGRHIEVQVDTDWLEAECRARLTHLLVPQEDATRIILRLVLHEFATGCVELNDWAGRNATGSIEYVMHHASKWITSAFVSAHPGLVWLHAAAATRDGFAILLTGGAGAGKSTLVARLLERNWRLLADDAVPLHPEGWTVHPLPFTPEMRRPAEHDERDAQAFLERRKEIVRVAPDEVAREPVPVGAIVFPEYERDLADASLTPLTVVSAAQMLAAHEVCPGKDRLRRMRDIFMLVRRVPCYRLSYHDSTTAAAQLVACLLGLTTGPLRCRGPKTAVEGLL